LGGRNRVGRAGAQGALTKFRSDEVGLTRPSSRERIEDHARGQPVFRSKSLGSWDAVPFHDDQLGTAFERAVPRSLKLVVALGVEPAVAGGLDFAFVGQSPPPMKSARRRGRGIRIVWIRSSVSFPRLKETIRLGTLDRPVVITATVPATSRWIHDLIIVLRAPMAGLDIALVTQTWLGVHVGLPHSSSAPFLLTKMLQVPLMWLYSPRSWNSDPCRQP
jgi:hypothetical protein